MMNKEKGSNIRWYHLHAPYKVRYKFSKSNTCKPSMEWDKSFKCQTRHASYDGVSWAKDKDDAPIDHANISSTTIHKTNWLHAKCLALCDGKRSKQHPDQVDDNKHKYTNAMLDRYQRCDKGNLDAIVANRCQRCKDGKRWKRFRLYIPSWCNPLTPCSIQQKTVNLIHDAINSKHAPA